MSIEISNINITDNYIEIPKNSIYYEINKLLIQKSNKTKDQKVHSEPEICRESISFDIKNINSSTANSIRRVLLGELEILCFNFLCGGKSINKNNYDNFILEDVINDRLNSIPLTYDIYNVNQILEDNDKYEINVTNITNDIIYVTTDDIKPVSNNKRKHINWFKNTRICALNSGCTLNIKNIHLRLLKNGRTTPVTNFTYMIINNNNDVSSVMSSPTNFHIGFHSLGIKISHLMSFCCDTIINRLKNSEKYDLDKNDERYIFKLDETYTIANLIVEKIYKIDNNIPFVTFEQSHPLQNDISIIIKHVESEKIYNKAIKLLIEDFNNIKKNLYKVISIL